MEKIVVNVQKALEFTEQDISDLMVAGLEGGINYWCRKAKITMIPEGVNQDIYASDLIAKGGTLELYDAESTDHWELTLEKFLKGVKYVCERDGYTCANDLMDNHDADTADAIIQYALFNEIVFG
jgi:hypothetical protein